MKVNIINRIGFEELEQKLREVPLNQESESGEQIFPYAKARILLRRFHPDEVNPSTFYLLNSNLQTQRDLHTHLINDHGINTLELEGALEIENEEGEIFTLIPPIIENTPRIVRYIPRTGEIQHDTEHKIMIPVINDGLHRVTISREKGKEFIGIFIDGAIESHPFYAHPNNWDEVKVMTQLPETKEEKKLYSMENCYSLYRDFGVLGVGKPRHTR